jgi:hypothetical protein
MVALLGSRDLGVIGVVEEGLDGFGGEQDAGHDGGESDGEASRGFGFVAAQGSEQPGADFVTVTTVEPALYVGFGDAGFNGEVPHCAGTVRPGPGAKGVVANKWFGQVAGTRLLWVGRRGALRRAGLGCWLTGS